ncbi:hypothetical protein BB560_004793 [Smittium megazygosporum]|uniref:L-type lectin-like domain-containing protein n=1 Tax=Smittium megazygosporum TaxID=133381 RepID=A0A2T9Z8E3_9FUNG|nr:hypothetical protein BB560_004793 [Smittium megazygosporum]
MRLTSKLLAFGFTALSFFTKVTPQLISNQVHKLSLEYPYIDDGFHISNWDFGGDAIVDSTKGVYLTHDLQHQRGWIWSTRTLPAKNWVVEFEFLIGTGKDDYLFGDGLAFWATKERTTAGPVFGNRDYFTGLGLFFDTYKNGRHEHKMPLVVAMMGDGKTSYDSSTDGLSNSISSCENYEFRGTTEPIKCRISYLEGKYFNVQLSIQGSEYLECITLHNVTIPEDVFMGFSALTGELSDPHQIMRVVTYTYDEKEAEKNIGVKMVEAPIRVSNNSNFGSSFIKLLIVCGVLLGAYYLYKIYVSKSSRRF